MHLEVGLEDLWDSVMACSASAALLCGIQPPSSLFMIGTCAASNQHRANAVQRRLSLASVGCPQEHPTLHRTNQKVSVRTCAAFHTYVAGITDGHETRGHHETKRPSPRPLRAHDNTQSPPGGRQGVSRPPGGGGEPHMIKHPIDLRPPLAVSHAVLVARSHTGETF